MSGGKQGLVSYETLVHAIAGSCGSVSAMALTVPIDTVRMRLLLDDVKEGKKKNRSSMDVVMQIFKEEGISSLYRGVKSTLESVAVSNFIYFYTFHGLKKVARIEEQTAIKDILFACLAGSINVLLTSPLWVVNTRMKIQGTSNHEGPRYRGLIDGMCQLYRGEGVRGLWSGTIPSLVLVSNPAIKFTVYETLKRRALAASTTGAEALDVTEAFVLGVVASLCATIVTYPVQVVQTKSRHGHNFRDLRKDASMRQLAVYLLKNFGVSYFYKGLDAKLIQSVITAGFMFLSYEQIAAFIYYMFGVQKKIK